MSRFVQRSWLLPFLALALSAFTNADELPSVLTVQAQPYTDWFELDARIEPIDQGSVAAQTSGRISRITVDVNDIVPSGALLIEITNTNQSAGEDQAKAALQGALARQRDADRQLARLTALVGKGGVSKRDFDAAKTEAESANSAVSQAKAALVQASENLGYTRIMAPYAGIVSARHVSLGETVSPGQLLLSGYAYQKMRLILDLPSRLRQQLKNDTPIRVTLPDGTELNLNQHQLFQFADPQSHTFTMRIPLPEQSEPRWHSGDWAKVALALNTRQQIRVPESAVLRHSELSAVYVKQDKGWVLRQVRLGRSEDHQVEILAGLAANEQIATNSWAIVEQQGGEYAPR